MGELTLFIDLDDTLYPADSGVWQAIRDRIDQYMHTVLGIPQAEVPGIRQHLFRTYGTTLRGLEATMHIDTLDYLRFVHDVPLSQYLQPDPDLRRVLTAYKLRKFIFTNGDRAHALRVLSVLGLSDVFDEIIDITMLSPYCKPMPEAFEIARQQTRYPLPVNCVLVDDAPRNLVAAHKLGFQTVLVGPADRSTIPFASAIDRLVHLPEVIPANGVGVMEKKA